VLIPALLVGLGLDLVGMHWFNSSELYTNAAQYHTSVHPAISSDMNVTTLVGNLFMLQNILVGTLGSNAPLWSLANEWWYYCVFGLFAAALTGSCGRQRVVSAAIGLIIAVLLPTKIMLWGTVWLLGIAAHSWLDSRIWRPHPIVGLSIFVVAMAVSRLSHNQDNTLGQESVGIGFGRDLLLGIAYGFALVSTSRMTGIVALPKFNAWLAEFSYTTYLFHFPALLFLVAAGYQIFGLKFQVQPAVNGLLYMLGLTAAIYLYCYAFAQLTERHTNVVRMKTNTGLERLFALQTNHGTVATVKAGHDE
jgi:peptidoglycan/LPS O-acetylase OafA/YrhL